MHTQCYYIPQFFPMVFNAGVKPSSDFEDVLVDLGAKSVGLPSFKTYNKYIAKCINIIASKLAVYRLPKNCTVFLQYPMQQNIQQLFSQAKKKGNKIVLLIHDINELRGKEYNYPQLLKEADAIIVHTRSMQNWIEKNYENKNCVVLDLFDYIINHTENNNWERKDKWHIAFAGSLNKALFLKKLNLNNTNCLFNLYGQGFDKSFENENVSYKGMVAPDILPWYLSQSDFGLIWDGDDINSCNGLMGQYLKFNCPYKASSYLASGIPVITWNQSGIAEYIKQTGIGIVVESLCDIPDQLNSLSIKQYEEMRAKVSEVQKKIISGEYYKEAIKKAVALL